MRQEPYFVRSVGHASQVLGAFKSRNETLGLKEVERRTGLSENICFRMLYTLTKCGRLDKVGKDQYCISLDPDRRYRIGYAAQGQDTSFAREVDRSLRLAAQAENLGFFVVENKYGNPQTALRNAEILVKEKVDLAIEFQTEESIAREVSTQFKQAGIPLISIDIPHPDSIYFGADNRLAGVLAGSCLGGWANRAWFGDVDELLLLEIRRAGVIPRARLEGMRAGLRATLRTKKFPEPTYLDGDGELSTSQSAVREYLAKHGRARRILVGASNDSSALGALRAFQESGRVDHCAVVGQNAELEARAEIRQPKSRFVGSVAFRPEQYGPRIIRVALNRLAGKLVETTSFTDHELITLENVDEMYPHDYLNEIITSRA